MSAYEDAAAALFAAVEPVAAYCARTARPNRHADQLDAVIHALADFDAAVNAERAVHAGAPDWEAIACRVFDLVPAGAAPPPSPLVTRCQALLARPDLLARAALPLAQRMALAGITSHHLGVPDCF